MDTRLLLLGRLLFGISLCGFAALHFVYLDFVTRVVPTWPTGSPASTPWIALVGGLLGLAGLAVITTIKPRPALLAVSVVLVLSFTLLHLPALANDVLLGGAWTSAGKAIVLLGAGLAVGTTFRTRVTDEMPATGDASRNGGRLRFFSRICLASFLILAAAQHLRWPAFVATLVPTWVPGGGMFWTYASAVLLATGGVGMLVATTARLAALGTGAMIFSWAFLLHLPRVIQGVGSRANETTALFEALAFSGLAFFLAATRVVSSPNPAEAGGRTVESSLDRASRV